MLIKQIIEFELSGLGPLTVHVFLWLVIFITKHKTKISKAIGKFLSELLFTALILQEAAM